MMTKLFVANCALVAAISVLIGCSRSEGNKAKADDASKKSGEERATIAGRNQPQSIDAPEKPLWVPFSGTYQGESDAGGGPMKFSEIAYFEGEPENAIVIGARKYLGTVDFVLLNANGAKLELPLANIQSIELGPNPQGIFGRGFATITMADGNKQTGTFDGRGDGDLKILLSSESGKANIDLHSNVQKSVIIRAR
jgi:hypothetical protein